MSNADTFHKAKVRHGSNSSCLHEHKNMAQTVFLPAPA